MTDLVVHRTRTTTVPPVLPVLPRLLARAVRTTRVPAVVRRVRSWPVTSQQGARRNALVACTALAARRAERDDVEDWLRAHGLEHRAEHKAEHRVEHRVERREVAAR